MRAYFIHVGQVYQAKVSGKLAPVRVEWKKEVFDAKGQSRTWYWCRNLLTGKQVICKSSQRLRDKPLPPEWAKLAADTAAPAKRVEDRPANEFFASTPQVTTNVINYVNRLMR